MLLAHSVCVGLNTRLKIKCRHQNTITYHALYEFLLHKNMSVFAFLYTGMINLEHTQQSQCLDAVAVYCTSTRENNIEILLYSNHG